MTLRYTSLISSALHSTYTIPQKWISDIKHIEYDVQSYNGIRKANKNIFGENFIPNYDFSKAKTIVSINSDPKAEIFKSSRFGIVGNSQEIMPALAEEIRKLKA